VRLVRTESGARLRVTAASAVGAGVAGVPVDARSPRDITGRVLWETRSWGAAKGAGMQAERLQGVPDRYSQDLCLPMDGRPGSDR